MEEEYVCICRNVPLQACIHRAPDAESIRGSKWPEIWPERVEKVPYWLNDSQVGVYGRPAPEDFMSDYQHWKHVVTKSYLNGMGISWEKVRNVMDMRSVYGGCVSPSFCSFSTFQFFILQIFVKAVVVYKHLLFCADLLRLWKTWMCGSWMWYLSMHQTHSLLSTKEAFWECIMIGVSLSARIRGRMIFSMLTISSPKLQKGQLHIA